MAIVVFVLSAILVVVALACGAALWAFLSGFQRGVALGKGTDQWAVFKSDEYGFEARLPANVIQDRVRLPGDDLPATRVRARHANGTRFEVILAGSPDASQWPGRMFQFRPVEAVARFPATGLVARTEPQEEGNSYLWQCAMSWNSSFCLVTVTGEDRETVDAMADQVYQSMRFAHSAQ